MHAYTNIILDRFISENVDILKEMIKAGRNEN